MAMYGDLVNGLCYTLFIPAYLWLWFNKAEPGAGLVNVLFLVVACASWISWYRTSYIASSIANAFMAGSIAAMNLYQWPHKGEILIFPQYIWSLLIVSFNSRLPFRWKMGITMNALGFALFVSFESPLIALTDALPTLLGATAVHTLFHYFADWPSKEDGSRFLDGRLASILLAGAFSHHLSLELSKMMQLDGYVIEGGYEIIKAGSFAALGLAAAGAFQKTVNMKEALEALVVERTHEIALQAEELRMVDLALQAADTAIAITDSFQSVVWSNRAMEELVNPEKKVRGGLLSKALELSSESTDCLGACFDPKRACRTEVSIEGSYYSVEVSPFPASSETIFGLGDCDFDDTRFLVAFKDVTEQRAREKAEKLAEQERFMKQGMKDSMETLTHELRSPLQGIMGMASMMLDGEKVLSEDARESLSIIMASSRHLLTLINNLLDVRKCDANMMDEFPLTPIPLASSMSDVTVFCRPMALVTNIDLTLTLDARSDQIQVMSNVTRLQQVLINLVSNSIKYAPHRSSVNLTTQIMKYEQVDEIMKTALAIGIPRSEMMNVPKEDSQVAVVSVCDTGPGISADVADKVFRKFAQVTTQCSSSIGGNTVAQPSGTGLGLNLCVKFVQRMNGNIWVSNNKEGGACFSFFIRVADADPAQEPTTSTLIPQSLPCPYNSILGQQVMEEEKKDCFQSMSDLHVLIVDDTVINLKVITRMLNGITCISKTMSASSGQEALSLLQNEVFDLVITDIQMPEMNGMELTDAIRRNTYLAIKPFVVGLTAETSDNLYERCTKSGMTHLLHKPVTTTQLQSFFRETINTLQRCDEVLE